MAIKGGLGRGLDALMLENAMDGSQETVTLRISEIIPNRSQPRKQFNEDALRELADSIATHGVIQPLLVRPMTDGSYQLVAGERRWRAARLAGLSEVPVVVREMSEVQAAQIAMVENLQREDLNPVEEAMGFKVLIDSHGMTQEEMASAVGKSRPAIANSLRLLGLPKTVLEMLSEGRISAGHGRAILALPSEDEQVNAAIMAEKDGMSVREMERMAKKSSRASTEKPENSEEPSAFSRDSYYDEVELALTDHLGRKVKVIQSGKGGTLQIEFYSKDDLRMLANEFGEE